MLELEETKRDLAKKRKYAKKNYGEVAEIGGLPRKT